MRLTQYSDYALRSLMYLAVKSDAYHLVNISDIANSYGISKNHLTKIIHQLSRLGLVDSVRGKHGGIRLAKRAQDINIGAVVRHTEADFAIVDCFVPKANPEDTLALASHPAISPERIASIQLDDADAMAELTACVISPVCQLRQVLSEATESFLRVLDGYTLEDLVSNRDDLSLLLA